MGEHSEKYNPEDGIISKQDVEKVVSNDEDFTMLLPNKMVSNKMKLSVLRKKAKYEGLFTTEKRSTNQTDKKKVNRTLGFLE